MRRRAGEDGGFTLLELIVALTIMGMAVGAVFGGLGLFFRIQTTQQSNARLDVEVRNYGERLILLPYTDCATAAAYSAAAAPPVGYTAQLAVSYWDGNLPAAYGATCTADKGMQQVQVTLTDSKGIDATLTIGKSK